MRAPLLVITLIALGACGNGRLHDLRTTGTGPDEFMVLPTKPLEEPPSFNELPAPTPGGANIVDPTPLADGSAALGGGPRSDPPVAGPIPGSDGVVVTYSSRFGVSPDIRQTLAAEDADFRRRKARFTNIRLVPVDRYNQAYKSEAIDPKRVADIYRRAGVPTPAAPPDNRRPNL